MVKWIIIFIIRFYQIAISPMKPRCCKYYPSCSQYFIDAVRKYGIIKGSLKGLYRILRCNPFSAGGYDPA